MNKWYLCPKDRIYIENREKPMKLLIDRILQDGRSLEGVILKVDKFINHQMDPYLMKQVALSKVWALS